MLYQNENLERLAYLIQKIKTSVFSIQTQYKFLKINKAIENEYVLYQEQKQMIIDKYVERNDEGKFIENESGGLKIKKGMVEECASQLLALNKMEISIPDVYFSLDELEPLGLTLEELILLEPFIKY